MRSAAIRALLWKELRQMGRNRTAMLTATFLPFIILFVAPLQIIFSLRLGGVRGIDQLRQMPLPGFSDVTDPSQLIVQFVYPMLLVLGGMLLPSMTTAYAIVAERERRSLELLVSLPVSVSEILAAKLLSVLVLTAIVGFPYVAVVITVLVVLGLAGPAAIPALVAPFVAAVACSTAISLLLTLLARDFRTANNLNGVLFFPVLLVTLATLSAVGGPGRTYVLSLMLLGLAAIALIVAMRWITFERYLE